MIGASAVLMWATLALLTTLSGDVPPFQLVAMSFSIALSLALVKWLAIFICALILGDVPN